MSWSTWLGTDTAQNLLDGTLGAGVAAGSIYGALDNADDTKAMGNAIQDYLTGMGTDLNTGAQFQGYGVTTGLGTGTVGADGSVNLGVGQYGQAQNAANAAYGAATNFANQAAIPVGQRQDDIYESIMATQRPELNRMQAQQQAQEYAMGRGGVRGTQFGGSAEDAAMARARAQASNQAAFQSREMANDERGMLGQLAGQFGGYGNQSLQASYLPMQQQMAAMGLGQSNADMAQTGQLTGLDYMAQLGLGGANANINAQHSANQLTGNLYNALLSNLGGVQDSDGGAGSGILGAIGGGLFGKDGLFGPNGPLRGNGTSDIRLKENVEFVGKHNDLNIYTWDWKEEAIAIGAGSQPTTGVLAQEVAQTHPDAVGVDKHGWLFVDYSKLLGDK